MINLGLLINSILGKHQMLDDVILHFFASCECCDVVRLKRAGLVRMVAKAIATSLRPSCALLRHGEMCC